ncbi:MAG: hypothetical protein HYY18_12980 [Planctomycetes bacterium]|nr:hypothetical protein [Planctomycetota bacterium]
MNRKTAWAFGVVTLIAGGARLCWSDNEAPPYAYVSVAPGGRYYFKMFPDPKGRGREFGRGVMYRVREEEADEEVWRTEGWYSAQTFPTADGTGLVRIGDWPRGNAPSEEHLGIAFYKEGKLLKSYSTKELIQDVSAVQATKSHYAFLKDAIGFVPAGGNRFAIRTVDDVLHVFDAGTGELLRREKGGAPEDAPSEPPQPK